MMKYQIKLRILVNSKNINNFVGHKKENVHRIKEIYNVNMCIEQDDNVKDYKIVEVS